MKTLFDNPKSLQPEADYQALMAQLTHHSHPRRKLKELQNKKLLTRLKKGFYVLSKELTEKDYSPQVAANLLYGPSYLSLEYALAFYNLIPERVVTVTSVTTQKNKSYSTPLGNFSYQHLAPTLYPVGVTIKRFDEQRHFLIATPEKALMDIFTLKFQNSERPTAEDIPIALFDDLRVDLTELKKIITKKNLLGMKPFYQNRPWNKLTLNFLLENL